MVTGVLIVTVLFVAPIPLVVGCWCRPAVAQNPISRAVWRLVSAFILASYYGLLPFFIATHTRLNPLLRPEQVAERSFVTVLVILASIFIALAAQQATYVIRLDERRRDERLDENRRVEATAAYFLVSCGFWAFSFAVPATFGLIGAYLLTEDLFTLGIYEAIIAILFVGGWIVLMAGALRRFGTPERPRRRRAAAETEMIRETFLQAKSFIFADVEREIQLAKADGKALSALGVNPGGGNFLAALGLLCYTEFGGKLRFGFKRADGSDIASANFNHFFDLLGPDYLAFRAVHNVYDIFRCGLAHEYYVKKGCTIDMLEATPGPGIQVDLSGHYRFVVESYYRDLRKAFDTLQVHLYGY